MIFARTLVATTDRAFTIVVKQGLLARLVRTRFVPWLLRLLQTPSFQRFLFHTVSQISINHRNSPLSEGGAGNIQAALARRALYIIRPDGYISFADAEATPSRFRQYLDKQVIHTGQAQEASRAA